MPYAKRIVEQITNVAIIIVCGVLCWSYVTKKTIKFVGGQSNIDSEQLVGFNLLTLSGYSWGSHQKTLVLALRVGCHYCEDSMPFYRALNGLERGGRLRAHFLVVMQEGEQAEDKLLESNGLAMDRVHDQSFASVKVSGTPTLSLADDHGHIEKAWVGELSPQGEKEVIAAAEE